MKNNNDINLLQETFRNKVVVVLLPTRNDWPSLVKLIPKLDEQFTKIKARAKVVIIDDGSTDYTDKHTMENLSLKSIENITEVALIRNQGNQRSIAIGIGYINKHIECDYLVVMDSDHEDRPEDILSLLTAQMKLGHSKIIFAERTIRSEGLIFRSMYFLYQVLFRVLTGKVIKFGNFCIVPTNIIPSLSNVTEIWNHFSVGVMRSRIPFSLVPTKRGNRIHGKSSMNFTNLLNHAINGFSVYADVIGVRLLTISCVIGLFIVGVVVSIFLTWFFSSILLQGWSSVIVVLMIILLVQVGNFALFLNFNVAQSRLQVPLIPSEVYHIYLMDVHELKFHK